VSICVAALTIVWWPLDVTPIRMAYEKHDRIGSAAAVLGIFLSFAAYRKPNRKRTLAHMGMALSFAALLLYTLFPCLVG